MMNNTSCPFRCPDAVASCTAKVFPALLREEHADTSGVDHDFGMPTVSGSLPPIDAIPASDVGRRLVIAWVSLECAGTSWLASGALFRCTAPLKVLVPWGLLSGGCDRWVDSVTEQ